MPVTFTLVASAGCAAAPPPPSDCPDVNDQADTEFVPPAASAVTASTLPSPDNALSADSPVALVAVAARDPSVFQTSTTSGRIDCAEENVANRLPLADHETRCGDTEPAKRAVANFPPAFASVTRARLATDPSIGALDCAQPSLG